VIGQVILEATQTNVAARVYIYAGGKQIALKGSDGQFYWSHWDHLGSTHKLTRADGSVAYRAEYDPHGQRVLEWSDIGLTNLSSHKFAGHEWDWATNLEYANARMYSHNRARFMQPDPIGLQGANLSNPQTLNRYTYVNNDPVNYLDPSGKFGASFACFLIDYGWYEDGYWWAEFRCYGPPSAPPQPLPGPEPSPPTPCSGIGGFSEGVGRFTANELNDAAIAVFGEMTAQQHRDWLAEASAVGAAIFNRSDALRAGTGARIWGATSSLSDVVRAPAQFIGFTVGQRTLENLGPNAGEFNEGERNCTKLQTAIAAVTELANGARPYNFLYMFSNYGGRRPREPGEERIGGNDFSARDMGQWNPADGWTRRPGWWRPERPRR
jgi:RHS repeat-associated protein